MTRSRPINTTFLFTCSFSPAQKSLHFCGNCLRFAFICEYMTIFITYLTCVMFVWSSSSNGFLLPSLMQITNLSFASFRRKRKNVIRIQLNIHCATYIRTFSSERSMICYIVLHAKSAIENSYNNNNEYVLCESNMSYYAPKLNRQNVVYCTLCVCSTHIS